MPDISPYLVIASVTVVICQITRFSFHAFSNEIDFKRLISAGGLPSTIAAILAALVVTSVAVDGLGSSVAGLTIVLAFVAFDILLAHITLKNHLTSQLKSVADLPQHSRKDLAAGALVGLLSSLILSVNYWKDDLDWLFEVPSSNEIRVGLIGFIALAVIAEGLSYITRQKNLRKLPTSRKLNRAFRLSLTLSAIFGLIITFAQQQTLGMFDVRIWTYLVLSWIILTSAWFWWRVYRHAKAYLAEEAEHFKANKSRGKNKRAKSKKKKRK